MARAQPECFDDLVAQVALFRPGPLQGGMVHPYVARRRGWEKVRYPHSSLEVVLRDTFGIILFQEQVLEVAHQFAGMPLQEADEFRRLVSHFRDAGEMEAMRERFVAGAVETHRETGAPVAPLLANRVFDLVSKFVGYGFCRSHAAAFARTVYQSSFLKAHHPAAYMAAVLEHKPGFYPLHTILEEARASGVKVLPPCVHRSSVTYLLERVKNELAIRVPLTQIEQLSPERAAPIILERVLKPFDSLDDLFRRVHLPSQAWDNLARSGALSTFGSRREVLWHLGRLSKLAPKQPTDQLAFDDLELPRDRVLFQVPSVEQSIVWDFATCHLTTGPHPIALRRAFLQKLTARPIADVFKMPTGTRVLVAGAVISRQRPPTAKGVCFLILEDESGRLPTALPPGLFERELRAPSLVVEGTLEAPPEEARDAKRGGKVGVYRSLLIHRLWSLDALLHQRNSHEHREREAAPSVHGSAGLPGENPRSGQRKAREARTA